MTGEASSISRVAVVDDNDREAQIISEIIRDAGYVPSIVVANGETVDAFAEAIRSQADAALCDHRLRYSALYRFYGADLVAQLTTSSLPAILVTQFPMDSDVSIRKWRHLIPVLLSRDDADDEHIRNGFEYCVQELSGHPSGARRRHRSLIRIIDLRSESDDDVIDAIVPSWNPHQAVRFPKSLIGSLQDHAAPGERFFAQVNLGAEKAEDLFFCDFELAPEPNPNNGLA